MISVMEEGWGLQGGRGVAVLNMVAREGFTDRVTSEAGEGESAEVVWRKSDLGRGRAGSRDLAHLKNRKEAGVARVGEGVEEVVWGRGACRPLTGGPQSDGTTLEAVLSSSGLC